MKFGRTTFLGETPGMDCSNFGDLLTFPLLCQHQVKFTFIMMLTGELKHFYTKTNSAQYLAQNIPYTC